MPSLASHQLRVAGVALQICESINVPVDRQAIITASLLHDMGNMIKSELKYFLEFLEPEGLEYWQKIQDEYFAKYGRDEHKATLEIVRELGMSERVLSLIDGVGFVHSCQTREGNDMEKKICNYADLRVAPLGVVSVSERLSEGKRRYAGRYSQLHADDYDKKENCIFEIEKEIFSHSKIKPEDINDASISGYVEKLKNFEL